MNRGPVTCSPSPVCPPASSHIRVPCAVSTPQLGRSPRRSCDGAATPKAARRTSRRIRTIRLASSASTSTSHSCWRPALGRTPRFIQVGFTSIDAAAARGDFDVGLSGIEDSPARRSRLAVTIPYYEFREVLTVRASRQATGSGRSADLRGPPRRDAGRDARVRPARRRAGSRRSRPRHLRGRCASVQRPARSAASMRSCSTPSSRSGACGETPD